MSTTSEKVSKDDPEERYVVFLSAGNGMRGGNQTVQAASISSSTAGLKWD